MPLRLLQIFVPGDAREKADELLADCDVLGSWRDESDQGTKADRRVLHLLVPAEATEKIMDRFDEAYADVAGFHVVVLAVEAALPRPENGENGNGDNPEDLPEEINKAKRVSREELYNDINDTLGLDRVFLAMTVLSTIVAAVGLLSNDVAVIIGAMVIAPLLGPNMAMALAATLGDWSLLRRATLINLVAFGLSLALSTAIGLVFSIDSKVDAIDARSQLDYHQLVLALAAGAAGTFAFTRGMASAVIGVMVAVALMPPTVALGMLLGSAQWASAAGAALLVAANVVCINLAAVATFVAQGVRPRSYYEEAQAKRATRVAVVIWVVLLAVLMGIVYVKQDSVLFDR